VAEAERPIRKRFSLDLPLDRLAQFDQLCSEWGYRKRGDALERLLNHLFSGEDDLENEDDNQDALVLHENGSLVLLANSHQAELVFDFEAASTPPDAPEALTVPADQAVAEGLLAPEAARAPDPQAAAGSRGRGTGIDLPGFVKQKSDRLRQSLHPRPTGSTRSLEPLPPLAPIDLEQALLATREHWLTLYGTEANAAVLEASMIWLAQEIWPQSDQSDGRPFTWSLAEQWILGVIPAWPAGPASFDRVMVAAGLLEDPFSTETLTLRIPTLIRRFVHRFRRRHRGTSFQTLEHTMTLQGALGQLNLPTQTGHRLSLNQIREAYREQALNHHPDAGGSADAMRRLNEAYQLLKELYRTKA